MSSVKISVFDITGKEVAVLVNQQLQPGTYETEWNASAFASGVYFYKLTSGNYTETKRMILMK
ncbi:MAG: T9SS type A sorting domain-containing protein [Ignavibacteria bacterium]|nr:T9SS type A sorting domain-containing protein [Ignavibacteria bacterium]